MRLLSKNQLKAATSKYSDVKNQVDDWCKMIKESKWQNLEEVKQSFPSAEAVENFTVINIKGNHYRLILDIIYKRQRVYFKYFLTHAEYDKGKWKNDRYYKS